MVVTDSPRPPARFDVLAGLLSIIVGVTTVLTLPALTAIDPDAVSTVLADPGSVQWWAVLGCIIVQGLLIGASARASRATPVAVGVAAFALSWFFPGALYGISGLAVLIALFVAILRHPFAQVLLPLAAAGVLVAAGTTVNGIGGEQLPPAEAISEALIQSVGVIVLPLLLGLVVRSRRDVRQARSDEQRARAGQRDAEVQAAVARERTAMARELHDIAAHHLSGIALMAAVVDRQIDTAPSEAHLGVRQIRAQSTAVLDDLRRLVGLLRDDNGDERTVETLSTIPELVDRSRQQGPIDLRILEGEHRTLGARIGPLAQLALYRTIQEALTNAATHAPGSARTVEIDDRDDLQTTVFVTNAAATSPAAPASAVGGFGLVGMRERAELIGAVLGYGPTSDGGWQVRVSVPREPATSHPGGLTEPAGGSA